MSTYLQRLLERHRRKRSRMVKRIEYAENATEVIFVSFLEFLFLQELLNGFSKRLLHLFLFSRF